MSYYKIYIGTRLVQKLGLKDGRTILLIGNNDTIGYVPVYSSKEDALKHHTELQILEVEVEDVKDFKKDI